MAYNVLIVDDELIIRQGIEYLIDWEKEEFHLVGKVKNGQEALDAMEKLHPDIVITDVEMPVKSGLELAKELSEKWPQVRMIMLSSHSDFEYVRPAFAYGAVDYILKPSLSPSELIKVLRKSVKDLQKVEESSKAKKSRTINRYLAGYEDSLEELEKDPAFSKLFPAAVVLFDELPSSKNADKRLEELNQKLEAAGSKDLSCGFLIAQNYPAFLVKDAFRQQFEARLAVDTSFSSACFFISKPYSSFQEIKQNQSTLANQLMSSLFYASKKNGHR